MSGWARGCALVALGRRDEAAEALSEAQRVAFETGVPLEAHRIGLELARVRSDPERARTHLTWFEARGLRNGANLARRSFPELAAPEVHAPPPRRLEVLGPMQFVADGAPIPVRGGRRRELLALLLEARVTGRREVSRLALLDALYPGGDETHAVAALRDMVYQLREAHGPDVILTTEAGYALGAARSDAEAFLERGDTHLWRGPYLAGASLDLADETVRETLHLALRERAEALLDRDSLEAARLGRLLCEADPYDLAHLRLCLRALRQTKAHKATARLYARARERLLEVGQVLPGTWAAFLEPAVDGTA